MLHTCTFGQRAIRNIPNFIANKMELKKKKIEADKRKCATNTKWRPAMRSKDMDFIYPHLTLDMPRGTLTEGQVGTSVPNNYTKW